MQLAFGFHRLAAQRRIVPRSTCQPSLEQLVLSSQKWAHKPGSRTYSTRKQSSKQASKQVPMCDEQFSPSPILKDLCGDVHDCAF